MLGDSAAIATIAVKDIKRAKQFYENTLGLKPLDSEQQGVVNYKTGKSKVLVYQSQFAGTNRATAFEHYEMPGMTLKGDVHVAGGFKAAWFKDPDGNILALVGG
jgi:catechol 2,3-dioxygenase-like lactoylglutathione lyase family enzyme